MHKKRKMKKKEKKENFSKKLSHRKNTRTSMYVTAMLLYALLTTLHAFVL